MRILITGGAGCLGSNLIEAWLPARHEIFVIDNFATGKREFLEGLDGLEGLSFRKGSVADRAFVEECFESFLPQIVIHAAASYKNPDDWKQDAESNIIGSINIANAAEKYGSSRLINFQTNLCYGRPRQIPVPVKHELAPFSSYGISKTAGEQYMLLSKIPTLSIRISNVNAPRLATGPIPSFYRRLKAGQPCFCSDSIRDFLDISDFIEFMNLAIQPDSAAGVFNVSSGEAHSIKEIFRLVARHLGISTGEPELLPLAADDIAEMSLDPSETERVFGWKAKVSFRDSIKKQLSWYDLHGISDIYSHLRTVITT